jgi:hypothetical protein
MMLVCAVRLLFRRKNICEDGEHRIYDLVPADEQKHFMEKVGAMLLIAGFVDSLSLSLSLVSFLSLSLWVPPPLYLPRTEACWSLVQLKEVVSKTLSSRFESRIRTLSGRVLSIDVLLTRINSTRLNKTIINVAIIDITETKELLETNRMVRGSPLMIHLWRTHGDLVRLTESGILSGKGQY